MIYERIQPDPHTHAARRPLVQPQLLAYRIHNAKSDGTPPHVAPSGRPDPVTASPTRNITTDTPPTLSTYPTGTQSTAIGPLRQPRSTSRRNSSIHARCRRDAPKLIIMNSAYSAPDPTPEQPMTREILMDARLPEALPTMRVEIRTIRMLAGHQPGRHVHNGPVVGSIVEGEVLFQVEGEDEVVLRPGDVFHEPAGIPIAHFDALGEDVTFLGYFPLTADQQPGLL